MKITNVAVVSQCYLGYEGLKSLLTGFNDIKLIGLFDAFRKTLHSERPKPEIILVCISDLKKMTINKVRLLNKNHPSLKLIIYNLSNTDEIPLELLTYGVYGVIYKDDPKDIYIKAIKKVCQGEVWTKRGTMHNLLKELKMKSKVPNKNKKKCTLTPKENDVLYLITTGKSNAAIANELFVSISTIKTHVANIYRKLGLQNRKEAICLYKDNLPK